MSVDASPEVKVGVLESVGLSAILMIVSAYASWVAGSLGPAAIFHLTPGIAVSSVGICGAVISILASILAWKGFGLNAIAALMVSSSFGSALAGTGSAYGLATVTVVSVAILMLAVHFTRRWFEYNPLRTFVALWGLTFASTMAQSVLYKVIFESSYPLTGVLLLKVIIFGLGGLTLFLNAPKENEDYQI